MICRLCLNNVEQALDLFEDEDKKNDAALLIAKHFWFEPKPDDGLSHSICWKCWNNILSFNSFYNQVEKAHKIFSEHIAEVKSETVEVSKNTFNDFETKAVEKTSNKKFHITEYVETILINEADFDRISETSSIPDINQSEISSISDYLEGEKLISRVEVKSDLIKKGKYKFQPKSRETERQSRKRKSPDDINAVNKKPADEDNITEKYINSKSCNIMCDLEIMKTRFNDHVNLLKSRKGKNHQLFTRDEYNSLLVKVKEIKKKVSGKTPEEYLKLTRYDVIKIESAEKLVVPIRNEKNPIIYYTFLEEYFQIIHETHITIGHGGRNRMMKELKAKYKNITAEIVMTYLKLCEPCRKNGHAQKKNSLLN